MTKVFYPAKYLYKFLYLPCAHAFKFGHRLVLSSLLIVLALAASAQYCQPVYQTPSCTSGDYIDGVQFNTISNTGIGCPPSSPNYIDYTGSSCTAVCPGNSYQITITNNANQGEYMAVCIDLNSNGNFNDAGEFFSIGYTAAGANISANLIIPQTATPGTSVIRVFCQRGNTALTQSDICGNLTFGDVQDYCLTINQPISINLGNNVTQCGGTVTLNAGNGATTYTWSDGSTNQTLIASTSGNYSATVTNASGCAASAAVNVYIKPVPVVFLGNDIRQCGGTATLNAGNPGQAYYWSDGETTQAITVNLSGSYSVSVTNVNGGCLAADTILVTFDTIPVVNLSQVAPRCGGTDTLDAGNAGSTYLWSDGSTNQMLAVSTGGIYRVTVTDGNTCTATAAETVVIHPLPAVTLSIQPNVCNTITNFNLYGGAPAGGIYYVDYAPDTSFNTVDAGIIMHHITYVYTDGYGCIDSAATDINVRKHPFITTLDPPAICSGSAAINLDNYFTPAGGSYSGLGVSTHYFYPPLSGPANDTIIDIVVDSYGCTDTSIYPLTVSNAVHVNLNPSVLDNVICAGQTVSFNAYGAEQYQYFINGHAVDSMSTTSTYSTFSLQNNDQVMVVGINACSTDSSPAVGFDVHPLPVVSAGNDTSVALGQSVQLSGSATGSGLMVYQWNPAALLNIGNIPDPVYAGIADSTVFTLVVSDTYGCIDSAHVTVHVFVPDAIQLPNVITPDGNGKNDVWKVNARVDLAGSRLVIFNRWGETVYEADSYNNDWGGTYKNTGEKLPDGTYYYEFKVPSQNNHLYKGAINILNGGAK